MKLLRANSRIQLGVDSIDYNNMNYYKMSFTTSKNDLTPPSDELTGLSSSTYVSTKLLPIFFMIWVIRYESYHKVISCYFTLTVLVGMRSRGLRISIVLYFSPSKLKLVSRLSQDNRFTSMTLELIAYHVAMSICHVLEFILGIFWEVWTCPRT